MGNIVPVGTKERNDVKVWLDEVSQKETLICVAIAIDTKDSKVAEQVAEEIKNQEMLILRKQGYEIPEGFKPEKTERKIDGTGFQVTMYRFVESAWKRKVTHKEEKKPGNPNLVESCGQLFR